MSIAIKESSMSKLSPFIEGFMSAMVMLPTTSHAKTRYIEPINAGLSKVADVESYDPFIEIGLTMRQVGEQELDKLTLENNERLGRILDERKK